MHLSFKHSFITCSQVRELEAHPAAAAVPVRGKADVGDAKTQKQVTALTEQLQGQKRENKELQGRITQLQDDIKKAKSEGGVDVSLTLIF